MADRSNADKQRGGADTEEALRESQRMLRTLLGNLPGMAYRCANDRNWTMEFISEGCLNLTGYESAELVGNRVLAYNDLIVADDRDQVWESIQQALAFRRPFRMIYRIRTASGDLKWVWEQGTGVFSPSGELLAIEGLITDISEQKRAEEALTEANDLLEQRVAERTADLVAANQALTREITERKQAEARFQRLFANLPDFVVVVDRHAMIRFVNRAAPGVPVEQLHGTNGFGHLAPESRPECEEGFQRALATGEVQAVEALDQYGHWWACRIVPLADAGPSLAAMVICTDITEQKKARDVIEKEQERLKRLLEMYERDRQLVAFEIHDGLTQPLIAAIMGCEGFISTLKRQVGDIDLSTCENALKLLRQTLSEARRLMGGLRPAVLDEFGILMAIESLAGESLASAGPKVEYVHNVRFDRLAAPLETALFRVVQEALNNARRHSRSERVRIELVQQEQRLIVMVEDWGIGFDPCGVDPSRFGLEGIRERARLFGGQAVIQSVPGAGTRIRVELPVVLRADEGSDPWSD